MIKKHWIHKTKPRLQKQTYTESKCPENALQCQPQTFMIAQLIVNQGQRKREIGQGLCLFVAYRSLKLLTDDQVPS